MILTSEALQHFSHEARMECNSEITLNDLVLHTVSDRRTSEPVEDSMRSIVRDIAGGKDSNYRGVGVDITIMPGNLTRRNTWLVLIPKINRRMLPEIITAIEDEYYAANQELEPRKTWTHRPDIVFYIGQVVHVISDWNRIIHESIREAVDTVLNRPNTPFLITAETGDISPDVIRSVFMAHYLLGDTVAKTIDCRDCRDSMVARWEHFIKTHGIDIKEHYPCYAIVRSDTMLQRTMLHISNGEV